MNVIGGSNCRDATLTLLGSLGLQQKKRITQVSGCQYGFEAGMETTGHLSRPVFTMRLSPGTATWRTR
jgi:hypothetical protein